MLLRLVIVIVGFNGVFEVESLSKISLKSMSSTERYRSTRKTTISTNMTTTVTTGNSFTDLKYNESRPWWFADALKDIAYYLRAYKFNEYDRRYESNAEIARREYYIGFPRPPLRSLHWEVHKYCEQSFQQCIEYLRRRIKGTDLKRIDDTSIIAQEQNWNFLNNSNEIEQADEECRKLLKLDDNLANPFEGPIERFQWRTTASYYMCWYTMNEVPELEHLSGNCDNFAHCLDYNFGPNNRDHRANDAIPYSCALYSFCPDPCCPLKHLTRPENCWNSRDNPCFEANPEGQRECAVNRLLNRDFRDVILNRWNVTCACPLKGFEWNSLYGMCIDIDECVTEIHNCHLELEVCINLPGNFTCICRWGYTYNYKMKRCELNSIVAHIYINQKDNNENGSTNSTNSILKYMKHLISSKAKQCTICMHLFIFYFVFFLINFI